MRLLLVVALVAAFQTQTDPPRRVIDGQTGEARPWAAMIDELAEADVVFVGENHDDPNTHKLELAILQELSAKARPVTLSLEMFERDVQEPLQHFGMGRKPSSSRRPARGRGMSPTTNRSSISPSAAACP